MLYAVLSVVAVNVLAVLVIARLGKRLSGTTDAPRPPAVAHPERLNAQRARVGASPDDARRLPAASRPQRLTPRRDRVPASPAEI